MRAVLGAVEAETIDCHMRPAEAGRHRREGEFGLHLIWRDEVDFPLLSADALALHRNLAALRSRAQGLFLELRLLHQPMGEATQEVEIGSAPVIVARPEPHLIAQQES